MGIGTVNERSLHRAIKQWYTRPGDVLEATVDGYVVDILRGELVIEIQTGSFSSVAGKLRDLVRSHEVLLVYPIAREKWIVKVAQPDGSRMSRRKSPKRGRLLNLFDELVYVSDVADHDNFGLEVLLTREEELTCDDGRGSWRRRGISVVDRELIEVVEGMRFNGCRDYLRLLPDGLTESFTNRVLAEAAGVRVGTARKMTYCLRRMGGIRQVAKKGNEKVFEVCCGWLGGD